MIRPRLAAAAVFFWLSILPDDGLAHSKTQPPDGAVLQAAPETVGMTFDRPMRITLITLRDAAGGEHGLTRCDGMALVTDFEAEPADLPAGRDTI